MKNQDTFVYEYGKNLYINLTNRCDNACDFCLRNDGDGVGGNYLWLSREPSAAEVIAILEGFNLSKFGEAVFCGYGEPCYKLNEVIEIGKWLKERGARVRLNTNGHSDLINGKPTAALLVGAVDVASISLNHKTAAEYQAVCHSVYGEKAFDALLDFAKGCAAAGIKTVLSIVDVIGAEAVAECRKIAEAAGCELLVRTPY